MGTESLTSNVRHFKAVPGLESCGVVMGFTEEFDVVVVGAGHAGCEAAMAAARMGMRTAIFTLNLDLIAQMSCNPAIGGIAKGHLVREVDALGGVMGEVADATGIQFRLLNTSRGPAVWSPRGAKCDKQLYRVKMREVLEGQRNLFIKQAEVVDLVFADESEGEMRGSLHCAPNEEAVRASGRDDVSLGGREEGGRGKASFEATAEGGRAWSEASHEDATSGDGDARYGAPGSVPLRRIAGVKLRDGRTVFAKATIVTTGTFLNGLIHCGEQQYTAGRSGERGERAAGRGSEAVGVAGVPAKDGNTAAAGWADHQVGTCFRSSRAMRIRRRSASGLERTRDS